MWGSVEAPFGIHDYDWTRAERNAAAKLVNAALPTKATFVRPVASTAAASLCSLVLPVALPEANPITEGKQSHDKGLQLQRCWR